MNGQIKIHILPWIVVFMLATPLVVYGVDGQIKITQPGSFPIVIDEPGSYVFTRTLIVSTVDANGIEIRADDVTLDLNGHLLIGPGKESGSNGNGIYANNKNNISIANGTVKDFVESGILLTGIGHQIKNISVFGNGFHGISATHSIIADCTASNNGSHGIYSSDSSITNCIVSNNGSHGISANSSTSIINCTSTHNGSHGFYASHSTITNCTAFDNSDRGMYASNSLISNCTANGNESHGIYASSGCRIHGNNLRNNGGYGLYLSSSWNYAIENVASGNIVGNFYAVSNNHMPLNGDNANFGW